jgi:hypothetical protein
MICGPRISSSPSARGVPTGSPVAAPTIFTSVLGTGRPTEPIFAGTPSTVGLRCVTGLASVIP